MSRALILGGTGALGRATATRLLTLGWNVRVTGRQPSMFDRELGARGVEYVVSERGDAEQLAVAVGDGVDLIVDCACFGADDARAILPYAHDATSVVMVSSKAVYVDAWGHHSNSDVAPRFSGPISESGATMAPGSGAFKSREGYGANKVAAELVLLDSGAPVSVVRASKVHGVASRRPREWYFVKRVLDGRGTVLLAKRGEGVDHPSAAVNFAALVEVLAARPAARIVNCADPDAPSVSMIARTVAAHFGHEWVEVLLDGDESVASPWDAVPPIVLDTSAAAALGYRPVGNYEATVGEELDWLVSIASPAEGWRLPELYDEGFFDGRFDYDAEDAFLSRT